MTRLDKIEKTITLNDCNLKATIKIIDGKLSVVDVQRSDRGGGHHEQLNCCLSGSNFSRVLKLLNHAEKILDGESV